MKPSPRLRRRMRPLLVEPLEGRRLLATITVNSGADGEFLGVMTLREAIDLADGNLDPSTLSPGEQAQISGTFTGPTTIDINVFPPNDGAGNMPFILIQPQSPLPTITKDMVIDGYAQGGSLPATAKTPATLAVVLDGTHAGPNASGLFLKGSASSGSIIKGIDFINWGTGQTPTNNSGGVGIFVAGANNITIQGNYFGFSPLVAAPTQNYNGGMQISLSSNDLIGGTTPAARNVFRIGADSSQPNAASHPEAHGFGMYQVTNSVVQGNYVGFDPNGQLFPNVLETDTPGVAVDTSSNNLIGGTTPGAGNVLGGLQIYTSGNPTTPGVGNNIVQGNIIGLDPTRTTVFNGLSGLDIYTSSGNVIGGSAPGAGNWIVNSPGHTGVDVVEPDPTFPLNTTIVGNTIGTDATLTDDLHLYDGVHLEASDNIVGGLNPAAGNHIYHSANNGIDISPGDGPQASTNNVLESNLIVASGAGAISFSIRQPVTPTINIVAPMASGSGFFAAGSMAGGIPGATYTAQFFTDDAADPLGGSEAQYFGTTVTAIARADGSVLFSGIVPTSILKTPRAVVTATITGPTGNTSQTAPGLSAFATMPEAIVAVTNPGTAAPGQPVALGAVVVTPGSYWAKPTGTVYFLDNDVVIGAEPLGAGGSAIVVTSTLMPGAHSIVAVYSGDGLYHQAISSPASVTVLAPPTVLSAIRKSPTEVQVTFSVPMNATSAGTSSYYQLIALRKAGRRYVPKGKPIRVAVSYDPVHHVATLKPAARLLAGAKYRLSITGQVIDAQNISLGGYVGQV